MPVTSNDFQISFDFSIINIINKIYFWSGRKQLFFNLSTQVNQSPQLRSWTHTMRLQLVRASGMPLAASYIDPLNIFWPLKTDRVFDFFQREENLEGRRREKPLWQRTTLFTMVLTGNRTGLQWWEASVLGTRATCTCRSIGVHLHCLATARL